MEHFTLALSNLQKTSGQSTPTVRSRANSICEYDVTERMDELERLLINAGFFTVRETITLKHQVKPVNN
jgi:hypothetical protein